jgi:hypothetical protein
LADADSIETAFAASGLDATAFTGDALAGAILAGAALAVLAAGVFTGGSALLAPADDGAPLTVAEAPAAFSIVFAGGLAALFAVRLGRKSWLAVMTFPLDRFSGLAFLDRSARFLVPFRT